MLHLAQVNKNTISGEIELQLLACQKTDKIWELTNGISLTFNNENCFPEGVLLLVDLGENKQIIKIEQATDWIINIIQIYLTEMAITPEFVEKERDRVEEWRQEITAQSLDLTRRNLEIETRRQQLQELEASLNQEKEKLEIRWQQLHKLQEELQLEKDSIKHS